MMDKQPRYSKRLIATRVTVRVGVRVGVRPGRRADLAPMPQAVEDRSTYAPSGVIPRSYFLTIDTARGAAQCTHSAHLNMGTNALCFDLSGGLAHHT